MDNSKLSAKALAIFCIILHCLMFVVITTCNLFLYTDLFVEISVYSVYVT